ncbi:hypothetical protein CIT26_13460 [Mesorhizobium temperatum]|uniref:DUF1259 domain-containing protein n=1 Tax=Mesorhizobium temperatum TaxID=241416 RepID=A0A271LQU2_9HYPH|nr:hypothetical protein CIT26_13460 [Mesorhizobium temperatum]
MSFPPPCLAASCTLHSQAAGRILSPANNVNTGFQCWPEGDFVLTASEVNPVVRALRSHDIEITALHNHMLDEEPRLFFMHLWANDEVSKLARGLEEALRHVNRKRE